MVVQLDSAYHTSGRVTAAEQQLAQETQSSCCPAIYNIQIRASLFCDLPVTHFRYFKWALPHGRRRLLCDSDCAVCILNLKFLTMAQQQGNALIFLFKVQVLLHTVEDSEPLDQEQEVQTAKFLSNPEVE